MATIVVHNAKLLTPARRRGHGYVIVDDGVIKKVAEGEPPNGEGRYIDAGGRWLAPGFIDIHVNGGGGGDAADGTIVGLETMLRAHTSHGTTAIVPTVVTSPPDVTERAIGAAAELMARQQQQGAGEFARLLGLHLEGPYISQEFRGAHDPEWVRAPDLAELQAWLAAHPDVVRMVTVAPELPGALPLLRWLDSSGVIPAIGHTAATYADVTEAAAAGARFAVHCFNAMRGFAHREPGVAGALLDLPGLATAIIPDGLHVHPAAMRVLLRARGTDHVALCTDAMRAAGLGDGTYELGTMTVTVKDGEARTAAGNLAGSTLTMDRAVALARDLIGISLETAVAMATSTPARIFGVGDRKGSLAPGFDADLVVFDDDIRVSLVMVEGQIVQGGDGDELRDPDLA